MKGKLKELLDAQIAGLLSRIDEENYSEASNQRYNSSNGHHEDHS